LAFDVAQLDEVFKGEAIFEHIANLDVRHCVKPLREKLSEAFAEES